MENEKTLKDKATGWTTKNVLVGGKSELELNYLHIDDVKQALDDEYKQLSLTYIRVGKNSENGKISTKYVMDLLEEFRDARLKIFGYFGKE